MIVSLKIFFGPYESHGIIRHKMQKLHGLLEYLNDEGYDFELVPTARLNRLSIEMKDREIFSCDIRNFLFNLPYKDDPICLNAIEVIKDHVHLFYSDDNIPNFISIEEGMRWLIRRNQVTTKDAFSSDVKLIYEIKTPCNSLASAETSTIILKERKVSEVSTYIASVKNSTELLEERMERERLRKEQFVSFEVPFSLSNETESSASSSFETINILAPQQSSSTSTSDVSHSFTICYGPCGGICPPITTPEYSITSYEEIEEEESEVEPIEKYLKTLEIYGEGDIGLDNFDKHYYKNFNLFMLGEGTDNDNIDLEDRNANFDFYDSTPTTTNTTISTDNAETTSEI